MGLMVVIMDYVIYNTIVSNQIVNFDLLNDHEFDYDQIPSYLTLNFGTHTSHMQENYDSQRNLLFDKSKKNLFLKD